MGKMWKKHSIQHFTKGERAYFKSILTTLRVLLVEKDHGKIKKGLIERFIDKYKLNLNITFPEKEGYPSSHPDSVERVIPFSEYLEWTIVSDNQRITIRDFISRISSQDGSHVDIGLSPEIAFGESIYIGDISGIMNGNMKQTLSIARNAVSVGNVVVKIIKEKKIIENH